MKLLSPQQLADSLGLSQRTIRKWARQGKIPCAVREGKVIRFDYDAVIAALSTRAESVLFVPCA